VAAPLGWRADGDGFVRPVAAGRRIRLRLTTSRDGDLSSRAPAGALERARAGVHPGAWTWLRQVHGARVVVVDRPGGSAGEEADAAVSAVDGAVLAMHTADCAVVALWSPDGIVGATHAGWRGLRAGVLERTVETMSRLGATRVQALLGPCIEAACYEFGAAELADIVGALGPGVASRTAQGTTALDLVAGVRAALAGAGVGDVDTSLWCCTACSPRHFSHRARRDVGRSALVIALEGSAA
jgi:purine-nucleoside/S-methyl-5'-thioadenosine phosphorylase / adenosine deaminase